MENPIKMHVAAVRRIMRYLQDTLNFSILYKQADTISLQLLGWTDSDYVGDGDDRKNTSGHVFKIGSESISWSSKKQPIVTLSRTKAEFVVAASCACQGI